MIGKSGKPSDFLEQAGSHKDRLIAVGNLQVTGPPVGYRLNQSQTGGAKIVQAKRKSPRGHPGTAQKQADLVVETRADKIVSA